MSNARDEWKPDEDLRALPAEAIAIVGMAVDVPGAASVAAFWQNLRDGVESITPVDEAALLAAGESLSRLRHRDYVAATARLEGFDQFDSEFFGFSAKEAAILDPQHRKFLEAAWNALESAGHVPDDCGGNIGVYAGCGMGSYFYFNICSNPDLVDDVGMFLLRHTGNDKDFLATRVSHILDLRGPSVNVQTACSTSLVAVHQACAALRQKECDMALAGGVTIELPQGRGYLFKENEILSPDGHCHAFDHRAQGTVFGSGAGCVVLRRLSDALADGDHVWAVIRGSAINNDGAGKASYLAPSVDGQAAAIAKAIEAAGVSADSIDYVECHGTGTYLGDPIEVSALTEAFARTGQAPPGQCHIGSVKTNIGHLDTAAGVAGLVKTALALKHRQIPPSLGYEAPNPAIDFKSAPFRVNDRLTDWEARGRPRRAGVNSLGVGGTNAHLVLEEAPAPAPSEAGDWPFQVLCISGRGKAALEDNTAALAAHLRAHPEQPLADIAFTLRHGRRGFAKRRVVVAATHEEAATLLEASDTRRVFTHDLLGGSPEVVFMFPGGGAQYPQMARDLYETEPVFAEWMDRGLDHLQGRSEHDIRALWLPEPGHEAAAAERLKTPSVQLPLIMIVEHALAQLWMSWGVTPAALVGHSMGENVAACLAGVMRFEDCLDLVALRGQLFDTVPKGGMLSVALPVARLEELVGDDLDIASVNAPELSAVSGPQDRLDRFAGVLDGLGVEYRRVAIDIAAHSRMLEPILARYRAFLAGLEMNAPRLTVISNRTGLPMTAAQATDPEYWVEQLRHRVEFGACIDTLAEVPGRVFLEVGPGKALSALAQMNERVQPGQVLSSLRHAEQQMADDAYFLGVIGRLWACGVEADWRQIWGEVQRNRVVLPTYAFQRKKYFIAPGKAVAERPENELMRRPDMAEWGYRVAWRPRHAATPLEAGGDIAQLSATSWLIFTDATGLADQVADRLEEAEHRVARVSSGDTTERLAPGRYCLAAELGRAAYEQLFELLAEAGEMPARIAHFWLVTGAETCRPGSSFFDRNMEHGFWSLLHLAQALGNTDLPGPVHVTAITNGAEQVTDEPLPYPEKSVISAVAGVIARELPGISVSTLDITRPAAGTARGRLFGRTAPVCEDEGLVACLLEDLFAEPATIAAAYRGGRRFEKGRAALPLPEASQAAMFLKGGSYVITGGLGGIGQSVARHLLTAHDANVALVSRTALPPSPDWESYLASARAGDAVARRIREVRALEDAGSGRVMVVGADVCNRAEMARARQEIEAAFGAITGVIHAAGAIEDGPLLTKTTSEAERVLAPKITGLRVLDEVFPDGTLDLMVLFASTSTITTPAGQVDYAAANAYFNAFAQARAKARTRVVSINWGVWAERGMAAEAMAKRAGGDAARQPVVSQPLLETVRESDGVQIYETALSAARHWVIDGHRTADGDALLPGTGYVELAAEAMAARARAVPFAIRGLTFLRPLDVPDGRARRVELHLRPEDDGLAVEWRGDCAVGGREGMLRHAEARIVPLADAPPAPLDMVAIAARCPKRETARGDRTLTSPQESHLRFGERWRVLRDTALGAGEGLAWLMLDQACREDLSAGYLAHPGLLDIATGWAMELVPGYDARALWVPLSYGEVRMWRTLPGEVQSWVRLCGGAEAGQETEFDITLCDAMGEVCVEIKGFRMRRLDHQAGFGRAAPIAPAEVIMTGGGGRHGVPLSPEELRLQQNIGEGIRPDEGPEALCRALAAGLPQIIVSSLDLDGLVAQADTATSADAGEAQSFERPELDGDYRAPETGTERELAAIWEQLLGVSPVGIEDSFFDLGGHSLIAVRLFARIKRHFDVEFPISVLFDAPTIQACAALIDERTGGQAEAPRVDSAEVAPRTPATAGFTHLVALNRAGNGKRPPLFIVAGMFGNVLNLRHLSQQIGPDQPVFGLQARGLIGDAAPHYDIAEAAADYLAELRQVQPQGPYLLGGFSGGGITAYEMARQLEAAGERVALLALLDTPLPVRPALSKRDKLLIKIQEFRRKGPAYLREWLMNRLNWEVEKRRSDAPDIAGRFNNRKIEMAFRKAVAGYDLQTWNGPALLFRPPLDRFWRGSAGRWISREREYVFADNQWTPWAPALRVIEVPGDHDSMVLNPNVTVLAAHLTREIAAALAQDDIGEGPDFAAGWSSATAAE